MNDTMMFALLGAGSGFIAVYVLSALLNFMVALKARPSRRAAWTVGIPYAVLAVAVTAAILLFAEDETPPFPIAAWEAPLLLAPGAILAFLLRLWGYHATWIDDDKLTDDIKLANDDWKVGLYAMLLFVAVVVGRALIRAYLRSPG